MIKKVFFIIFCSLLVTSFSAISVMSEDKRTPELESLYGLYIDKHISRCESKTARINSESEKIRQEAALHSLMGSYYRSNKTGLIKELKNNNIRPDQYRIDYYLNSKFFSLLREAAKS